ncbi:MAG: ABC transporter substrate-binding protein [Proteobacteria bacterium]|nr:ABC transporter substrate-binding protein [Pseudomonadota bacterium]
MALHPSRLTWSLSVLLLVGLAQITLVASAVAAPDVVRIGTFTKTLPTIVAEAKGFWAEQNVTIELSQVTGSLQQAKALRDGEYDLAFSSADNAVNYRINRGNKLGAPLDVQIIAAQDLGAGLRLLAKPDFANVPSLRRARLALDAPDSGFAFVLYKMLGLNGLERGRDYDVTSLGGTAQRLTALLNNQTDATLLSAGFDVRARDAGFTSLMHVNDIVRPYLGIVIMGRESWMRAHDDSVVRFLRGYMNALAWSLDPLHRAEAIVLLAESSPGTSAALAAKQYEAQVAASDGLATDMTINVLGLRHVLDLRQEFGGFDEPKTPEELAGLASRQSGLWTDAFLNKAIQSR